MATSIKAVPAKPEKETVRVNLKRLNLKNINIALSGDSPLICHAWTRKARQEMLDKMMKVASTGRAIKDPVGDFRESLYPMPDGKGFGFPVIAFKAAAVDAANSAELKKTEMRAAFHVCGELTLIKSLALLEPVTDSDREYWEQIAPQRKYGASMRSDMVRVGMGAPDIRFRPQFLEWSVEFQIRYNASVISVDQIVNLFNIAGFGVGVGEHRPQRDGSNGMFHVITA